MTLNICAVYKLWDLNLFLTGKVEVEGIDGK